jgi:hypothetical protein
MIPKKEQYTGKSRSPAKEKGKRKKKKTPVRKQSSKNPQNQRLPSVGP